MDAIAERFRAARTVEEWLQATIWAVETFHLTPGQLLAYWRPKPAERLTTLENHLLAALVQANEALNGRHPDPEAAKRAVGRALGLFDLSQDDVEFYCLPTTADLPKSDRDWTKR